MTVTDLTVTIINCYRNKGLAVRDATLLIPFSTLIRSRARIRVDVLYVAPGEARARGSTRVYPEAFEWRGLCQLTSA